ncbi:MAG: Glu/Leu/Phe/Val family dehydrogenase [Actinomycetota bacterium]
MFEDLIEGWDGELVAARYDGSTPAWMFVCVHSTALGPAMGGTRMKSYLSPHDALADGLRLAQAMSMKQAAAGLPFGGGKAVLAVTSIPAPGSAERRELLLRYGSLVDALHGTYVTAADMNTGPADLDVVNERTPHVMGTSPDRGGAGDSGGGTATGVFHAIRASVAHAFGDPSLEGRTVLVQGVGSVGSRLARLVAEAGAIVAVSDVDDTRAATVAAELGASIAPAALVPNTPCDVFAPCATGGVLNAVTIPRLRCRIVAGAANNQLATPEDADRLTARGILYAPDYVANAGGVLHLAGLEALGWDETQMAARLAGIEVTLAEVFAAAERDGITTAAAADRLALARIAAVGA